MTDDDRIEPESLSWPPDVYPPEVITLIKEHRALLINALTLIAAAPDPSGDPYHDGRPIQTFLLYLDHPDPAVRMAVLRALSFGKRMEDATVRRAVEERYNVVSSREERAFACQLLGDYWRTSADGLRKPKQESR